MLILAASAAEPARCSPEVAATLADAPRDELVAKWATLCAPDPNYEVGSVLGAPPAMVRVAELQLFVSRAWQIPEWCPAGQSVVSQATKLDERNARTFLYAECHLERFGLMSADYWADLTGPIYLPWLAALELRHGGLPASAAAPLVRRLAGPVRASP